MHQEKKLKIIYLIGLVIFISFIIYAYIANVKDYINDSIILIFLLSFVYFIRKHIYLSVPAFILFILGLISHNAGVFGFYNASPFPIQYDHITHFLGLFVVSILIFNYFKKYLSNNKVNNSLLLLMILLAALGIGALIEQSEFLGYMVLGQGEGFLKFGGYGDTLFVEPKLSDMDIIGGGYINTGWDLVYNFLGTFSGVIFMYIFYLNKKKK